MIPKFKVTVTHSGTPTTYENTLFKYIRVKKRENNYDMAELHFADKDSVYYEDYLAKFDDVKIWLKGTASESYTTNPQFGGIIRQVVPSVNIGEGYLPRLVCKGYGAALEATNCNRDYGIESANPSYPATWNILKNIIFDFVEKSFDGAATGWDVDNTYVTDNYSTEIKYINNPFRNNLDAANVVCNLTSAIGAGTAGGHWIVIYDATGATARFLFAKIGDHAAGATSPETYWPDWWNANQAGSTLVQGVDFLSYSVIDKAEEFANKVVLITDFRRPAYDYWTNNEGITNDAIWSVVDCTATAVSAVPAQVVGDKCLKITATHAANPGYCYFAFSSSGSIDLTKIGSIKTIPRLNFYSYKPAGVDETQTYVRLYKTAYNTDYWQCQFSQISQSDDVWAHKSIPIGPYWKSDNVQNANEFVWQNGDIAPDWTSVKGICFVVKALTYIGVDDLHISGKLVRSAYDSGNITANNEYQKVLIARNSMDDSLVAADDTGFAGRIAYAELLRRMAEPVTISFSTATDMKAALAGQKLHVHACKKANGTFRIDTDMRILEVTHEIGEGVGYVHSVTATTDLTNSHPISVPDQYAMWQENMFLNSKEAKNIRSGAEVDLLISLLEKDYI